MRTLPGPGDAAPEASGLQPAAGGKPATASAARDFGSAFSLTSVLLLPVWMRAAGKPEDRYFLAEPESGLLLAVPVALTVISTLLGGLALRRLRRRNGSLPVPVHWIGAAAVLLALNAVRQAAGFRLGWSGPAVLAAVAVGVLLLTVAAVMFGRAKRLSLGAPLLTAAVILLPIGAIGAGHVTWILVATDRAVGLEDLPLAGPVEVRADGRRVVVIVLDEFDAGLGGLDLPAFQGLSGQSLVASEAYPPSDITDRSIPALLSGRLVSDFTPLSAQDALVRFPEGDEVRLSLLDTLFSRARASGYNVGVVGWYHPYCRLFADDLAACRWEPGYVGLNRLSASEATIFTLRTALTTVPGMDVVVPVEVYQRQGSEALGRARVAAREMAANASLDLVYLHLNVPHPVGGHGYVHGLQEGVRGPGSYRANAQLADEVLRDIVTAVEEAGLGNSTAVILTSDHGYRPAVWGGTEAVEVTQDQIPFVVRIDRQAGVHRAPFNTIALPGLAIEVLRGQVGSNAAAAAWLAANAGGGESPYLAYPPARQT